MLLIEFIHSRPQSSNETLLEYIQSLRDSAIQATGTEPTVVTCQEIIA